MKLSEVTNDFYECDSGWHNIIDNVLDVIRQRAYTHDEYKDLEVLQIKEKLGDLRIYLDYYDDYLSGVIHLASKLCETICEDCGQFGFLHKRDSCYKTLCDDHAKAEDYKLCWIRTKEIKTKKQYENVLELIEVFMDENSENEELDKLATMAEAYEKKHYPMD